MEETSFTLVERTGELREESSRISMLESLSADQAVLDDGRFKGIKGVLRALANPSLHAIFLLRVITRSESIVVRSLARRLLITLHSIDINPNASIGPELTLVHPFGLAIGDATLGRSIAIFQNVTIGHTRAGAPTIDDEVTIYAGSTIIGPVLIGKGATIGAGSYVDQDVPPGMVVAGGRPGIEPFERSDRRRAF
jgi:serine O-acetyltransferase